MSAQPPAVDPEEWTRDLPVALLVVDSHLVFADALAGQLREEVGTRSVDVARSIDEARATLTTADSEIVVVHDETMARDAPAALRAFRVDELGARVLVLSQNDDVTTVIEALELGACGWISKDMDLDALLHAITQVTEGHLYLSPPVMTSVLRRLLSTLPRESTNHTLVESLTQREMEILRCLVAGMSKREIAERLYVSIHTVRSHVQRMMQRAEQHSTLSLVATARRAGVPPMSPEDLPGPPAAE